MQRLSRAGRKRAVIDAINRLNSQRNLMGYTQGEICRKMGVTSQSKIRDLLREMVKEQSLVIGSAPMDNYQYEIDIFNIAHLEQMSLPDHVIVINGQSYNSNDWRYSNEQ